MLQTVQLYISTTCCQPCANKKTKKTKHAAQRLPNLEIRQNDNIYLGYDKWDRREQPSH